MQEAKELYNDLVDEITRYDQKKSGASLIKMTSDDESDTLEYFYYMRSGDMSKTDILGFDNLISVHFDEASDLYILEFQTDDNAEYIDVSASNHPEAASNEDYFDNKEIVEKIIEEN